MFDPPINDPTSSIKLADWLEIKSMLATDRNASRGDLEGYLRVASFDGIIDGEEIESKILEVFFELEQREISAAHAYPFRIDGGIIRLKSSWNKYPAYVFCLLLSYFGLKETKEAPRLFESISCQAAKSYLRGNAIGFGFPRTELPSKFSDAVTELCRLIGEGGGFHKQALNARKDDTLDVVAWVDFKDKLPSKLILFGQCAAGENWTDKLAELQPDAFWGQWMIESVISPVPIKSYFVPHRIEREKWDFVARKAGIMFDRCRIAYWAHEGEMNYASHINWVERVIQEA
jgi:hypothetical protein